MLNFLLCVVLLLGTITCRYVGDSCFAEDQLGSCTDLSQCEPLQDEIRAAGNPMPHYLAKKLQKLSCGYNSYSPLVCCISQRWSSGCDDTEVPNRKKPPSDEDSFVWNNSGDRDDPPQKKPNTNTRPNTNTEDNRAVTKDNTVIPDIEGHPNLDKLSTDCGVMDSFRISGGNRTALYEMPWMAILAYNASRETKLSCGGTIINEWYVLTAAHCVAFLGERMVLDHVILGEWNLDSDPDCERMDGIESCAPRKMNVGIASVIAHPGYSPQTLVDDIALIRLAEPADFTLDTMAPICLPITRDLQSAELVGQTGVVAGWGITELGITSSVLLSVGLPIISNKDCQAAYRGSPRVYDRQMCAGGEPGKDSCGGDSGGPLLFPGVVGSGGIRYVQRGIVSYGSNRCGIGGFPGVYTRVAYYMDWILNNIS